MKIIRFEDLDCWKVSRQLTNFIYQIINNTSFKNDYRLKNQITGASISIMNNIAEGFDSQSNAEFIRFLTYARRSAAEARNCIYIINDQNYANKEQISKAFYLINNVSKLIDGLLRYLKKHKKQHNYPNKPN